MLKWLKDVFTAGTGTSFARVSAAATTIVGCWSLVHVVLRTHHLPDGLSLTGLAGWMTAPYAISKATNVFSKDGPPQPGTIGSVQASGNPTRTTEEKLLAALLVVSLITLIVVTFRTH